MKRCLACGQIFIAQDWHCPQCGQSPHAIGEIVDFIGKEDFEQPYSQHYYEQMSMIEAKNFWFQARNELIIWAVRRFFSNAVNLLEIGCGTGFVLQGFMDHLPGLKLTAADYYMAGIEIARKRVSNVLFYRMDARKLPFEEEFDIVGAFDVLEHIQQDEVVLRELFRTCRRGVVLTVPQHTWLWSPLDDDAHHVRRYERSGLLHKLCSVGFRPVYVTSFVSLLLPLMLLSRWRNRYVGNRDVMQELNMTEWLNKLLLQMMRLEQHFIMHGYSWPVGGSLLVVAKKQ